MWVINFNPGEGIMKLSFYCLMCLYFGGLWGGEDGLAGNWRLSGGIGKVFDTPLGAVYRIEPGEIYYIPNMSAGRRKEQERNKKDMPQMGGLLSVSILPDNKPTKRIVVIDFKIRAYPVFSKEGSPDFEFSLVRSENSEMQHDYKMLNGLLMIRSDSSAFLSSSYQPKYLTYIIYRNYPRLRPDFELLAMRVIFDTATEEVVTSFNGQNEVSTIRERAKNWPTENIKGLIRHYGNFGADENKIPVRVRSLGITCMAPKIGDKPRFLEISSPVVRLFDKMEDARNLKPALFSPYPYGQYLPESKKPIGSAEELIRLANRDKNPEVQYAAALRLLYGNEDYCFPREAVKLLEKAARDGHVLALYQLGVCHYRGYGTAADTGKALRYLRKAGEFNYQNAEALEWFIQWDMAQRPCFIVEDFIGKIEKLEDKYVHFEHDLRRLHGMACAIYGSWGFEAYSLKDAPGLGYVSSWINKDERAQPKYFIDHAINAGYAPAYTGKARYFRGLDEVEKLQLLKNGVEKGDAAAIPELLLALARNNQLSADEFTVQRDLMFAENALYQFLARAIKNPAEPGVKAYLAGDPAAAKTLLENSDSRDKHLLMGLSMLANKLPCRMTLGNNLSEGILEAVVHLEQAAALQDPVAQYILAYLCFRKDLPLLQGYKNTFKPQELLESAVKNGHLKASMLMAELALNNSNHQKALSCLEKVCENNYAPAFYLRGEILQKSNRKQEADRAFQKAAELGDHRGVRMLALSVRNNPKLEQKLWHEYIQADLRARAFDQHDPYFPVLYQDLYKWKRIDPLQPDNSQNKRQEVWLNQKIKEFEKYRRK